MKAVPNLLDHLESYLGACKSSFAATDGIVPSEPSLLLFDRQPFDDANTIITFGLSNHLLSQPKSPPIRQELVMCFHKDANPIPYGQILTAITRRLIDRHKALLRGDVLFLEGPIVPGYSQSALVCTNPWYWAEGFEQASVDVGSVIVVWLVPVFDEEGQLIQSQGLAVWEQKISNQDIDLLDLRRKPLELGMK